MAFLTSKRLTRSFRFSGIELRARAGTFYQGSRLAFDTAGFVVKSGTGPNLFPFGRATEDTIIAGDGGIIHVTLDKERHGVWLYSAGGAEAITVAGGLAYEVDDQTISNSSAGGTRTLAGRVWKTDAFRAGGGVFVEAPN